ncbi:PAS domain-containing sensor histidine kinase [Sediminibacterium sp.]|uniref:PAS domain-containing sensor histidine kinase n=1 Tax=Sediminibacterium sp. TaxID=1917865 RepID=UPI003F70B3FA
MEPLNQSIIIESPKLYSIFLSLPQPSFIWHFKGDDFYLVGFNQAARLFASNQIEQLINSKASNLYKNEQDIIADLYKCLKDRLSFDREIYYQFKSKNEEKYIHVHYVFVNDEIILVQAEEITEKKKVEQFLIASENRFHSLADNALVGSFILKKHKYTYVNKEFANIFGYEVDDIIGMYQDELILEDDKAILKQYFSETADNQKTHSCEISGIHKNNSILNLELFGTIKTINGQLAIIGSILDITERKKAERRLIEAQEAAKVGSWETDLSNLQVLWSDETYSIFELDKNSFKPTHNSFLDYIHPEDKEMVNNAFLASFDSKEYNIIEHRVLTSSGKIKYVEERWKVSFDASNKPVRVFGTCQDISLRKKVEIELIETRSNAEDNANRLSLAAESANLGIWDWNILDDTLLWDDRSYQIHGVKRGTDTNVFATWSNRLHPENKERVLNELNAALKGDSSYNTIFKIIKPSGEIAHIKAHGKVLYNDAGIPYRMIGMINDITETIQYEERLALSSLILNSTHDAIMSITLDGIITSWNRGAENILGYTSTEAIGQSIYMLIPPELHEEELKITSNIKEKKAIDRYETVRIGKDGSIVSISLTVSPILNELNQVIGASKIMRDISLQKASEYEKAQIMNDLIQRNKDLEQFAYIVSHNLRAPVANIIGVTNFLKMPDIEPDENLQLINALNQSADALDTVIKDLSLILQIRREVNEQKALIKFSEIIKEIQLAIDNLIKLEQVSFILDFSEVDEINSIKSYIYSIFYNLVSNSIKYKKPQTTPIIKIKSELTEKQIILIFSDNGLGIDLKKNREYVFGLYKRFHYHTEGKGMGLFMVKTQVETLGGKISIISQPNKGTEFKIELPVETIR